MTKLEKREIVSDTEKLERIKKNIENVDYGLTGHSLFFENVRAIMGDYINGWGSEPPKEEWRKRGFNEFK